VRGAHKTVELLFHLETRVFLTFCAILFSFVCSYMLSFECVITAVFLSTFQSIMLNDLTDSHLTVSTYAISAYAQQF